VGIAAAELGAVGPGDPVQEPAGVVEVLVGAHEVEHGAGVLDEVVGEPDGVERRALVLGGGDRPPSHSRHRETPWFLLRLASRACR
jgi:hypothetical protein